MSRRSAAFPVESLPVRWVNGEQATSIEVTDRGFRYGDGLFETLRIIDGDIEFWDLHQQRLEFGMHKLRVPISLETLRKQLQSCLSGTPDRLLETAVLRITVSRGMGPPGYKPTEGVEPTVVISIEAPGPVANNPARLVWCKTPASCNPALAGLKHLNRLDNVLAADELNDCDADEGLMTTPEGVVVSGIWSNVFVVTGGELRTPLLETAGIEGTIRRFIVEILAPGLGIPVRLENMSRADVTNADEVFLTNSLMGLRPVAELDAKRWSKWPLTQRLQREFAKASLENRGV